MNAHLGCDVSQSEGLKESRLDNIGRLPEPAGNQHRAGLGLRPREFSQNLQDEPLNGDG